MTPKEYLQQLRRLDIMIDQRNRQLADMRSALLSAADPGREYTFGGMLPGDSRVVAWISKLQEREEELDSLIDHFWDLKCQIIDELQGLDNPVSMQILYKRYVEYKRLEIIAVEINYSYDWVKHAHGRALQEFARRHPKTLSTMLK